MIGKTLFQINGNDRAVHRNPLTLLSALLVSCLFLPELSLPIMVSAQESYCDPHLNAARGHPYEYRIRGDRCEGIYIEEVSSTTLMVVSLTESFEEYDLASGKELLVKWTAPGNGSIRLRASSLKHKLYYRMDTVRPPADTSYLWPLPILAALNIPKKDIGVVGWTQYAVGDTKRSVYVPLRLSQQREPGRLGNYQLVLLPGRELTEVFVSLVAMGADGRPKSYLRNEEPLQYGYYPAGRGIMIPLAGLETAGIYYLEIGARLRGGGSTAAELWFYHPGE